MHTTFIEASQSIEGGFVNWGKFMVGRFDADERTRPSYLGHLSPLLSQCGWGDGTGYVLVLDLQTGEGSIFRPGGLPSADLEKHRVWVCPLFEPFLEWLYQQELSTLDHLPHLIELPEAPFAMSGHRRPGVDALPDPDPSLIPSLLTEWAEPSPWFEDCLAYRCNSCNLARSTASEALATPLSAHQPTCLWARTHTLLSALPKPGPVTVANLGPIPSFPGYRLCGACGGSHWTRDHDSAMLLTTLAPGAGRDG